MLQCRRTKSLQEFASVHANVRDRFHLKRRLVSIPDLQEATPNCPLRLAGDRQQGSNHRLFRADRARVAPGRSAAGTYSASVSRDTRDVWNARACSDLDCNGALAPLNHVVAAWGRKSAAALSLTGGGLALLLAVAGFLDRDPHRSFAANGRRSGASALYFSGDMGLRFGMGPATARALAAHGVPVVGFNSSTLFRSSRTRAETNAIVAQALREVLRHAGNDRIVLIGQSYGADILQTGLAALPLALRARVSAVVLVVPGRDVFFRADPTGLAYTGTRDSDGAQTIREIDWARLTCIYGSQERDSACPALRGTGAKLIRMPGGHFLHHDSTALIGHVLSAIEATAPSFHS